ncbi:hypothetical protein BGX24_000823 [Mortierella sp. AD032]|nr:hypothetical protein BGX24_000823 [Mortierella sp. AD032]
MIPREVLRDNMVFLDSYGTSFWTYVRGQGATVLLVNGSVLLLIVTLASALDPYPYNPIYQYKKAKARHIVATTNLITLRTSQDWSWNDACIYVPPTAPPQAATRR